MPTEKIYDIIDQAGKLGYAGDIGFHRLSEPLLDPRYVEVWEYAKKKGMKLLEPTNGDVLRRNPELCSRIDASGNRLTIGLYDSKTGEQAQREMEFWKGKFRNAEIFFSQPLRWNLYARQNAPIYDLVEKDPEVINQPCFEGRKGLRIRYDGNVCFCCQDDQCTFNLGNAFEQPIEEIWWSDRHAKIIKTLERPGGRHQFSLCRNCYASQRIQNKEELSRIAGQVK